MILLLLIWLGCGLVGTTIGFGADLACGARFSDLVQEDLEAAVFCVISGPIVLVFSVVHVVRLVMDRIK